MSSEQLVWIRVPKTGGTSIHVALKDHRLVGVVKGSGTNTDHRVIEVKHCHWGRLIESHPNVLDFPRFTVVRNPWDRFVSGWKYFEECRNKDILTVLSKDFARTVRSNTRNHIHLTQDEIVPQGTHILRFEEMREVFAYVQSHVGVELDLRHLNRSDREPGYRQYFQSPSVRSRFEELFHRDISRFGYEF